MPLWAEKPWKTTNNPFIELSVFAGEETEGGSFQVVFAAELDVEQPHGQRRGAFRRKRHEHRHRRQQPFDGRQRQADERREQQGREETAPEGAPPRAQRQAEQRVIALDEVDCERDADAPRHGLGRAEGEDAGADGRRVERCREEAAEEEHPRGVGRLENRA